MSAHQPAHAPSRWPFKRTLRCGKLMRTRCSFRGWGRTMRFLAMVACAMTLMGLLVASACAEKRVARAIGNAAYRSMPRLIEPKE